MKLDTLLVLCNELEFASGHTLESVMETTFIRDSVTVQQGQRPDIIHVSWFVLILHIKGF